MAHADTCTTGGKLIPHTSLGVVVLRCGLKSWRQAQGALSFSLRAVLYVFPTRFARWGWGGCGLRGGVEGQTSPWSLMPSMFLPTRPCLTMFHGPRGYLCNGWKTHPVGRRCGRKSWRQAQGALSFSLRAVLYVFPTRFARWGWGVGGL